MSVSGPGNSSLVQSTSLPPAIRPQQPVGAQGPSTNAGGQSARNSVAAVAQSAAPGPANARRGSIINIVV